MRGLRQIICHSFYLGWRDAWKSRVTLFALILGYLIGKSLWASVWTLVPETTFERLGASYGPMVWYALLTGLVNYPVMRTFRVLEEDIRSGSLATFLLRPVSYLTLRLSEWAGICVARLIFMVIPAMGLAYGISHFWPFEDVLHIAGYAISVFLGMSVWLLIHVLIGLSSAWVHSARSIYQLVSKGVLVLGGVILPISHYPGWVQVLAWCTPFPSMLYIPTHQLVVPPRGIEWLGLVSIQLAWIATLTGAVVILYRIVETRMLVRGKS